jgi:hypothetical protein
MRQSVSISPFAKDGRVFGNIYRRKRRTGRFFILGDKDKMNEQRPASNALLSCFASAGHDKMLPFPPLPVHKRFGQKLPKTPDCLNLDS